MCAIKTFKEVYEIYRQRCTSLAHLVEIECPKRNNITYILEFANNDRSLEIVLKFKMIESRENVQHIADIIYNLIDMRKYEIMQEQKEWCKSIRFLIEWIDTDDESLFMDDWFTIGQSSNDNSMLENLLPKKECWHLNAKENIVCFASHESDIFLDTRFEMGRFV
jgi:hypothetical protein